MSRPVPNKRDEYKYFLEIPTRWNDNDIYGHVNNSVYYLYFDTIVNRFLIDHGLLSLGESKVIGLVVETGANFFSPLAFPDELFAGLRVAHLGNSSVKYEVAIFKENDEKASVQGHFVHVYVDEETRRPTALTASFKSALQTLINSN